MNELAGMPAYNKMFNMNNKKRTIKTITITLNDLLSSGNSYPHIGHTVSSELISIAQAGHSFFFNIISYFDLKLL